MSLESGNCKVGDYMTHPAFLAFDSNGFWVGKFESGYKGATSTESAAQNNSNSANLIIKPNVYSWRNVNVGNAFKASYDYLREDESHMMKNTEWGAVAYLSHSLYGKNGEVYINNQNAYMTGCGGDTANEAATATCKNKYAHKTENIYNQSTTGNISDIFDMAGGAWEYVMGYNIKASALGGNSGLTSIYENFFSSKEWKKYYDEYHNNTDSQYSYSARILGDATGEMGPFFQANPNSSWYHDYGWFVFSVEPWFIRGGELSSGVQAGIFSSSTRSGISFISSFRLILVPQK